MMTVKPIMIMAGGTGGHVFPALAVADELRLRGVPVIWLGTRSGIESRIVTQAGFTIEWLNITGLRGKGVFNTLLMPVKILIACVQAIKVFFRRQPCVVLGMGGFVSGPGGLIAWLMRKPLLIHEQNAVPGLTNKLLSKIANQVLEAFPGVLGGDAISVGNPVRKSIADIAAPNQRLTGRKGPLRVLVLGGSQGATRLNEIVPEAISLMAREARPEVHHQCGAANYDASVALYRRLDIDGRVEPFIDDMASAYAWADIVICRSGAMTVFELAAAGVGSILIPYPFAVDDHQTANARYLENVGAAYLCQQKDISAAWLKDRMEYLTEHRDQVLSMANAARSQSKPDSAGQVANYCMSMGGLQ